jgi:hypothetical protein
MHFPYDYSCIAYKTATGFNMETAKASIVGFLDPSLVEQDTLRLVFSVLKAKHNASFCP